MPPEPKDRVKTYDQGDGRGHTVPISRSQLKEMGVDPDAELEVVRTPFANSDRAEMRLRFYVVNDG